MCIVTIYLYIFIFCIPENNIYYILNATLFYDIIIKDRNIEYSS